MKFKFVFCLALALIGAWSGCSSTPTLSSEQDAMHWGDEYGKADAEMNRVYQKMLAGSSGAWREKLQSSQQTWIAYRDAEAALVKQDWEGGSGQTAAAYSALAELTRERTRELEERFK